MVSSQSEFVKHFTLWDYLVFAATLLIPSFIGLYYACTGGKQRTTREFLMTDRNMGVLPVSLSLLASVLSAVVLLGITSDVYNFDASFVFIVFGYSIMIAATANFYLPLFYKLKITSVYEYLERRFNKIIRRIGSLLYIMQTSVYMAVVLYAPALALSQVTGFHMWASLSAVGFVCIFYTTLGGLKAIMWTDAFQVVMMFASISVVTIWGYVDAGGIGEVWQRASDGNKLEAFKLSLDPFVRHTFLALSLGGAFTWLSMYGINQAQVQRYLSTPTIKIAQRALWLNLAGFISLIIMCCSVGLVMYKKYWDCDPLATNRIKLSDQLLPLFVMDTMGLYPGVAGFFVAGIFSGAMSTIATGMNSLAAVTLEDFIKSCYPEMSDKRATLVSKILAVSYGILCFTLVAIAERLGNVMQAALSIFGTIGGPLLGVFSLGIFFPSANSIGAGVGLFFGLVMTFWIAIGAQLNNAVHFIPKSSISTVGCFFNTSLNLLNSTDEFTLINSTIAPIVEPEILSIYKLSYLWYSLTGCNIVVIVGLIVSYISGRNNPEYVDPDLTYPFYEKCCCCLPENLKNILKCGKKESTSSQRDTELNSVNQNMLS